jgi:ribosomal protein S12 methylthiotransferase accessory factor
MITVKRHLAPFVVPDEAVYLVSERGVAAVQGELAADLVPLLDGTRDIETIVRELGDRFPEQRVRGALGQLVRSGRITETDGATAPDEAAYWELAGLDGDSAAYRVLTSSVRVVGHGDIDVDIVTRAVRGAGLNTVDGGPAALTLVACDDYLRPTLAEHNAVALATGEPWLLARPIGSVLWVGPLFRPHLTGCWRCLEHRLSANRQALSYLRGRLGRSEPMPTSGQLPLTLELGANLAALEATRYVAGVPADEATVLTLDTLTMSAERHVLVRRPQCPACGDPGLLAERGREPVAFVSQLKVFTADGGHRARSPEDVLEQYGKHVSPITGVVTALAPCPDGPPMLKVYTAGQNLARQADHLGSLRTSLRSLSCGKGMSDTQARASAICESIERYSGVFQGDEPRVTASYDQLDGEAIHPQECSLFSVRQYRQRETWNARGSGFTFVSEPLDSDRQIEWSPVWSLTENRTRWLPTSYLYYGYPRASAAQLPLADSNGNAAGTTLEDAALQGFIELVERDSVALWWYNRVRRPALDLDSFAEPYIDGLRDAYSALDREVWALDLTSDLGIPAVGAFSRRVDRDVEDILIAFGAHFDPRIAVLRALTELNQFLAPVLHSAGNGCDGYRVKDPDLIRWWTTATVDNQPYLVADPTLPASTSRSWPSRATPDLADDLALARRIVENRGLHMLVLDQTRPDIGLPVAKVIVPGLRHFWARFAPGRLYEVPAELGWVPSPLEENDLNPIPMFI